MPHFPPEWLDRLRQQTDIVQTISGYTPLKKNGRKYWGLCPFHGEKTPSFSVDGEKQLYYCFGCKAGGNVIRFVMDIERLDFHEAVVLLADRAHMDIPQQQDDRDYQRQKNQRERLLAANLAAAQWFHQQLFTPAGEGSLAYLKKRGLTDAVIRRFGLGASPQGWDTLTVHLQQQGFTLQELSLAGLTVLKPAQPATATEPAKPQRAFDMFRNRAIFPIIDQYGHVLAFGGRAIDGANPKYLNTSDTPIFNKRQGVYAANLLKKERNLSRVVLVEGYMDVVSLRQFGVEGVVATLGTALTPQQARLLRRFAPEVWLAYDGDSAGQHAIERGLGILQAADVPARVLVFPDGLDPDEYVRRDGREGFDKLPALTPQAYQIQRLQLANDLATQEGRVAYAKACAPILKTLQPVDLQVALQQLMVHTGFSREVLLAQIDMSPSPVKQENDTPVQNSNTVRPSQPLRLRDMPKGSDTQRAQETVISILATGRVSGDIAAQQDFDDPLLKRLFMALSQGRSPSALVEEEDDGPDRSRVIELLVTGQTDGTTDELLAMAHQCLGRIRAERLDTRLKQLRDSISSLTGPDKANAMKEYQQLQTERRRLKLT